MILFRALHSLFLPIDLICGNECVEDFEKQGLTKCECGNSTFTTEDYLTTKIGDTYCCTSPTSTCIRNTTAGAVVCKNGTMKSINEKCYDNCPFSLRNQCSPSAST